MYTFNIKTKYNKFCSIFNKQFIFNYLTYAVVINLFLYILLHNLSVLTSKFTINNTQLFNGIDENYG